MEKKIWSSPQIFAIGVENTEYGGDAPNKVDGPYIEAPNPLDPSKAIKFWPMSSS